MNQSTDFFADLALARRLEGADAAAGAACAINHARFYPEAGSAALEVAGGSAAFTGVDSPVTQAFALGLHGEVTADEMERLEEFYRSRGAAVNIEVCPLADASLVRLLGERGYRPLEFSNVQVRSLSEADQPPALPAGLVLRRAAAEEAGLWARTVGRGFIEEGELPPGLEQIMTAMAHDAAIICLFAELDGEIAGGGSMRLHQGVIGLSGASTLPRFRRRGIQSALVATRLAMAAAAGCELAMVTTLPGSTSQRNMERRGFRVVYTRCKFLREWPSA